MKRSLSHNDIRSYLHIGAFLFSILFFSFALFSLPYFLGTAPKVEAGSCDARVSAGGVTAYNGQSKTVTASSRWVSVYFYGDASGNNSQARWSSDGNWSSWKSNLPMSFSNTQYVNGGSETYSVQSEGGFWWHRVNCSASVTVRYQNPPSAVISANPSSITEPETTDIDYVCYNSRRAYINGHYIDYRSTDGTLRGTKTYQPSSDQTYTLRCTNTDGDADTDSVTVDVTTPPRCSISMRAGSSTVSPGESTRITWESTYDADGTLIASGQWGQQQAKKNDWGSEVVTPPSSPGTYTYGLSGSDILSRGCSDSVSVTVSSPPPIATLSAIDSSVYKGEGARLSYSCENSDEYSVNTQPKTSASGTHTQSWNTSGTKSNSLVCSDRASGLSDSDGASVEVVNRSPNARYEWSSADGGDTIYINVISNDSDPDGDSVRLSSVGGANYGNASESGGRIRYTAPSNLDGIDVIRYTIVDDDGNNPKTDSTYSYVRVSEEVNPPSVSLSVSPSSVDYGDPSTLSWTASGEIDSCTATGDWSGSKSTSDSESTGSQYDDSSYTLSCTGPGGTRSDTEQVDVGEEPVDPPSVSLSVSPSSVDYGDPSTLSWTASGEIDSCTATGDWSGSKSTSDSESTGSQYDDSSYTLECEGPGGSDSDTENVTVGPEPEPNSSPDADNDSYTVFENSSNNSFNVLLNDSDSDGDSLSITSITDQPDNGSASISSNRIYYTPNNGYTGNDSLRYRVSDGNGGTDTAQVSITVQAAEDYSMQLSPSDVELSENTSGTSDTVTVTIIRLNGFDGTVNLSIDSGGTSPELSGVGYSFGDSTLTGSETQSTLVVTVDDLLDPGTYTVRVRAHTSEEPGTRYRSFDINVDSPIDPEYEEF